MRNYLYIDAQNNMLFDGLEAECWHIALGVNVSSARVKNISPGQLYTFLFEQNYEGFNTFQWPSACVNGTAINLDPNSITIQNFIGDTGGILRAHVPGTWQ
jgi:hypothetical protein